MINENELAELKALVNDKTASKISRLIALKKLNPNKYEKCKLEVNVNSPDELGTTALAHAIMPTPDLDGIRLLLDAGADVNIKNASGKTALMIALFFCRENGYRLTKKIMKMLIDAGADVNIKDDYGTTVYEYATKYMDIAKRTGKKWEVDLYKKIEEFLKSYGAIQ
jgi:ankyrin repeat protein